MVSVLANQLSIQWGNVLDYHKPMLCAIIKLEKEVVNMKYIMNKKLQLNKRFQALL